MAPPNVSVVLPLDMKTPPPSWLVLEPLVACVLIAALSAFIAPDETNDTEPATPFSPVALVVMLLETVRLMVPTVLALLTICTAPPLVPDVFICPAVKVAALPPALLPVHIVMAPPVPPPVVEVVMVPALTPVAPLISTLPPLVALVLNVTVLEVTEPVAVRKSEPPVVDKLLVAVMLLVVPVVLRNNPLPPDKAPEVVIFADDPVVVTDNMPPTVDAPRATEVALLI